MDLQLAGRVALVNAASRGIGRAIAEALAAEGAVLVISARDEAAVARTAGQISAVSGTEVVGVAADVSVPGTAERLVDSGQAGCDGRAGGGVQHPDDKDVGPGRLRRRLAGCNGDCHDPDAIAPRCKGTAPGPSP